jgi:hypothetical protein
MVQKLRAKQRIEDTIPKIPVILLERKVILIVLIKTQEPDRYLRSNKTIEREADSDSCYRCQSENTCTALEESEVWCWILTEQKHPDVTRNSSPKCSDTYVHDFGSSLIQRRREGHALTTRVLSRQPWFWLTQLRDWIRLLRTLLVSLDADCKEKMEEVMISWRDRGRKNCTIDYTEQLSSRTVH